MLLLIVTLTLYFNGNEITTHLIQNQIYYKFRNTNFAFTTIMSCKKITETLKGSHYYKQTTNNTINAIIQYSLCKYVYEKRTDSCIFCVNMYKEN